MQRGSFLTEKILTDKTINDIYLQNNLKQLVWTKYRTGDAGIHQVMALCQRDMTS